MPDIALLSINTFQKDLNDGNPIIRAMVNVGNQGAPRHVWDQNSVDCAPYCFGN
jgi:hypothetical protein